MYIWLKDSEEVPYKVCDERARAAIRKLLPEAEDEFSQYREHFSSTLCLMSPPDMIEFVDSFKSPHVNHFDTGNIMPFQFPEH